MRVRGVGARKAVRFTADGVSPIHSTIPAIKVHPLQARVSDRLFAGIPEPNLQDIVDADGRDIFGCRVFSALSLSSVWLVLNDPAFANFKW